NGRLNADKAIRSCAQPANAAPTVVVTSPANGGQYTVPATITLAANASDSDGTIVRVDFLMGSTLITGVTSPPYSTTLTNLPDGQYTLTAMAVDNQGAVAVSSVAISVAQCSWCNTLWGSFVVPTTVDSGDVTAHELGMRFRAGNDGWVTAIRFYK